MGSLTKTSITEQSRPVYRNWNGQYLYYWPEFEAWRVGADYQSTSAGVASSSRGLHNVPTQQVAGRLSALMEAGQRHSTSL